MATIFVARGRAALEGWEGAMGAVMPSVSLTRVEAGEGTRPAGRARCRRAHAFRDGQRGRAQASRRRPALRRRSWIGRGGWGGRRPDTGLGAAPDVERVPSALVAAGLRLHHARFEPGAAQVVHEGGALVGGPDDQPAAGPQRLAESCQAGGCVEAGVALCREVVRTVVRVEEDRVERLRTGLDVGHDVAGDELGPGILERPTREVRQRAAVPADDGGNQLGDHDPARGGGPVERCAQRVAHAEAADQHAGAGTPLEPLAPDLGEVLLGVVGRARHQRHVPQGQDEVPLLGREPELLPAG